MKPALGMLTILLIFVVGLAQLETAPAAEQLTAAKLTGSAFRSAIEQPLSGSWANVELRTLLTTIADERRVAFLLDRRIDPTVVLPINLAGEPLRDGFRGILHLVGAEISVSEPVIYAGPPPAAWRLRTLVALRASELTARDLSIPEKRRTELTARHGLVWQDLETPAEILQRIAERYRLTIRNLDRVPHDLWAGNTLPSVNAIEALTLILIQFDLTFAWSEAGEVVELIPVPSQLLLERHHRAKGRSVSETLKLIQQGWPKLDSRIVGSEVVVLGLVEHHEAIASVLNGSATTKSTIVTGVTPIRQRQFTLMIDRVSVRELMQKLEESDIEFEYDPDVLTEAGIDLDQAIKLEVNKASAEDFFKMVFGPLKLSVQIDNLTVKLTPREK